MELVGLAGQVGVAYLSQHPVFFLVGWDEWLGGTIAFCFYISLFERRICRFAKTMHHVSLLLLLERG